MLSPFLHRFEEAEPGVVQLEKHLITDFSWKGFVGVRRLHEMVGRDVVEVLVLKDEGLAHIVVGQVPQVLRGEGGHIDPCVAWIPFANDMLLNQLHGSSACLSNVSRHCFDAVSFPHCARWWDSSGDNRSRGEQQRHPRATLCSPSRNP